MPLDVRKKWESLSALTGELFSHATAKDLPQPESNRRASSWTLLGATIFGVVLVWAVLLLFSLSLQFIAGDLLYDLAWKYSAIFTVPLGIRLAVYVFKSTEMRRQLGRKFWFAVFALPFITYMMIGLSLMKIPASVLFLAPIPRSSELITVNHLGPNPQQCLGKISVNTKEYPSFLQTGVCVRGEVARALRPGDVLFLKGKKGLGGFLVERYGKAGSNNSLHRASPLTGGSG